MQYYDPSQLAVIGFYEAALHVLSLVHKNELHKWSVIISNTTYRTQYYPLDMESSTRWYWPSGMENHMRSIKLYANTSGVFFLLLTHLRSILLVMDFWSLYSFVKCLAIGTNNFRRKFHLDNVRKEKRNTEANKPIYTDQQSTQCGDYSSEILCVLFFSCINLVKDTHWGWEKT